MRSLACCAVLLLASVLGSTGETSSGHSPWFSGTDLGPSPVVANSPDAQDQTSSPPEPTIALGPVTLPTAPSAPSASPPVAKGAVSPAVPTRPQNAPTPVTPPKEYNAPPPVELTPPAPTHVAPVAPPQAAVENPAPVLPGTPALLPSVQAPAPSVARNPNLPIVQPPSVNNPPSRPIGSGNGVPPYPPPQRSLPAIPPSTSGVPRESVKPPVAPPIIAQAPRQQALAPSSDHSNGNSVPPANTSPPHKNSHIPRALPPKESSSQTGTAHKPPIRGSAPAETPLPQNTNMPAVPKNGSSVSHDRPPSTVAAPKPATSSRYHGRGGAPKKGEHLPFAPSYPPSHAQGPENSRAPRQSGAKRQKHHAPPPMFRGHTNLPAYSPSSAPVSSRTPTHSNKRPHISPTMPPIPPQPGPKAPSAHPIWALPPPPPNLDCNSLACPEPLTDPPAGAPCVCVLPIKVGVRLSVDLYSFFPLVSDFAEEVSSGVNMAQRQVRVMGANVAGDQPDKTVVLVDLVPMQVKFDNATAFLTFENLWSKKISLKPSVFGDYEILYVVYPGLPPSPPSAPESVGDGAFGNNRNARAMKPLGVDVGRPKKRVNGSLIAIAVLSTVIALIICTLAAWLLIIRFRGSDGLAQRFPHSALPKFSRSSGTGQTLLAGRYSSPSGPSGSLGSSIATYAGQAKTFKFAEIEKATNSFDDSTVLGEGGFGCVYQGTLEDGTRVAVKVLKRYDGQGEREFLAEVEMLGRLHHRNLVKLLGICVEENARCLVYELIPNGSVESHLHGVDLETAPLDWNARMKIALGAARALAYLHEDSSPCVIHRDFKSSNILLEHDFTPKVSDFGLARTARGEGNQHISTRVMGTFGYVAPEYAMTGHLLVKSDVYSYGVVLLELLTGRKPVDMSRPGGQENLVSWARPLLTNVVSLRQAVDPLLGPNVPLDNVAKAAAIASMCVQPEVAHRPSMGEVVQALKLVCSDGDEGLGSGSFSQELAAQAAAIYDVTGMEAERVLLSEMFGSTPVFTPAADSGSFRKQSSSGPLMTGKNRKFWQRLRSLSRGSMSEHGASPDFETRSQCSNR
ncbi:receptor-like serine/threonine-protein kinase ALE2 isoform X1 [Oryza sativa Japonica Group]|uniref:receptor-like serine/threonine-protein kinase ALE2 isoform X1 n=1 Tax=Oryza sativa subsp. japonica TaxID=39947 RepID=UPI000775530D|nr:receptor-like serine/threonine-protein kinase ALE2 isoform X1 [Oryza sativa Japonica Group]XP_025879397.1 receptor-like serine/threonine-protein kinase ALE2 isoform X1 [Oryza sativa Japonica Group]